MKASDPIFCKKLPELWLGVLPIPFAAIFWWAFFAGVRTGKPSFFGSLSSNELQGLGVGSFFLASLLAIAFAIAARKSAVAHPRAYWTLGIIGLSPLFALFISIIVLFVLLYLPLIWI